MTIVVGLAHLVGLAVVVLVGAVVPVVPTGAAVSAAAAAALHSTAWTLPAVLLAGALGAWLGDIIVYWLMCAGVERVGERRPSRLRWRVRVPGRPATSTLGPVREQLDRHGLSILLVSRLLPGGRVPVLAAAAGAGYPVRRFAEVDVMACLLWSVSYAAIGVVGGSLFAEPWQGVVAAVALVLLATAATSSLRAHRAAAAT